MSTTAMDKPPSELEQTHDPNRSHIRKAFNLLKTHAAAVATFTLQWQDLEDHLQSIHNSIQSKLHHLQNPSLAAIAAAEPSDTVKGIPIGDGAELARHLRERAKDHDAIRDGLRAALSASERPGELVLEAVAGFHPPEPAAVDAELGATRRSCVVLLEEFAKAKIEVGAGVKEEAIRVATEWKRKMNAEIANSLEVLGFLTLLSAFGLVGEFDRDEVLGLIGNVVLRKQAPDLFRSLGLSDKASDFIENLVSQKKCIEAVRFIYAFELVDKFPPVPLLRNHVKDAKKVANTILKNSKSSPKEKDDAMNKEMAALRCVLRCIEEYKLESDFSPENLKQRIEFLRNQKKAKKANEKMAKPKAPVPNSQAQQVNGNKRSFFDSKTQFRNPQNGNKHPRTGPPVATVPNLSSRAPAPVHPMHHRPVVLLEGQGMEYLVPSAMMAIPSSASPNISARAAAAHTTHHRSYLLDGEGAEYARASASAATAAHTMRHRSLGSLEGEGAEYSRVSSATAAHTMHHRSLGVPESEGSEYLPNASNLYSIEAPHYQPSASSTGQRGQYSPVYYNAARAVLDAHSSLPAGSPSQHMSSAYGLAGSIPETRRVSSAHYGLADSSGAAERISLLDEQYGASAAASGRVSEFGHARALQVSGVLSNASPRGSLAYYPGDHLRVAGHSERTLPSSSDYELLSKRNVFHL